MPRALTASQTADHELARLLQGYSIEVTTHSHSAVEACRAHLAPGTEVYIAFVPGETHHAVAATAARLRAAEFEPVPHVTARSVAGFTQLDDFLARLASEAGVTRALVIAGDLEQPAGPYHSSLELLQTGLFQRHGIGRIGLACYPEAHRRIDKGLLEQALLAKLELVRSAGLDAWLQSRGDPGREDRSARTADRGPAAPAGQQPAPARADPGGDDRRRRALSPGTRAQVAPPGSAARGCRSARRGGRARGPDRPGGGGDRRNSP